MWRKAQGKDKDVDNRWEPGKYLALNIFFQADKNYIINYIKKVIVFFSYYPPMPLPVCLKFKLHPCTEQFNLSHGGNIQNSI